VSIELVPDDQALLPLQVLYSGDAIQVDDGRFTINAAKEANEGIKDGSTRGFGDWNPSGEDRPLTSESPLDTLHPGDVVVLDLLIDTDNIDSEAYENTLIIKAHSSGVGIEW
jgi:hypothetical protein